MEPSINFADYIAIDTASDEDSGGETEESMEFPFKRESKNGCSKRNSATRHREGRLGRRSGRHRKPPPKTKSRSLSPKHRSSLKSKALPDKTKSHSLSPEPKRKEEIFHASAPNVRFAIDTEDDMESVEKMEESMEKSFRSKGSKNGGNMKKSATRRREGRLGKQSARNRRPPPKNKSRSFSPQLRKSGLAKAFPEKKISRSLSPENTRKIMARDEIKESMEMSFRSNGSKKGGNMRKSVTRRREGRVQQSARNRRPPQKTKSHSLSPERRSSLRCKALPEKTRCHSLSPEHTGKYRKESDESMEMPLKSIGSKNSGKGNMRKSATHRREGRIGQSGRHRRPPPKTKSRSLSPEHRSSLKSKAFPDKTRSRSLSPEKTRKSKKEPQDGSRSSIRSSRRNPNGRQRGRRKSVGMVRSHQSQSLSPERPQVIDPGLRRQVSRSLSPERKIHGKRGRRTSMRSSQKSEQDWLDNNDSQASNLRNRGRRSSIGSSNLVAFDQVRAMLSASNFEYDEEEEEDTKEDSSESECVFLAEEEGRKKNKWKKTKTVFTKMTKKVIGKQGNSFLFPEECNAADKPLEGAPQDPAPALTA